MDSNSEVRAGTGTQQGPSLGNMVAGHHHVHVKRDSRRRVASVRTDTSALRIFGKQTIKICCSQQDV